MDVLHQLEPAVLLLLAEDLGVAGLRPAPPSPTPPSPDDAPTPGPTARRRRLRLTQHWPRRTGREA